MLARAYTPTMSLLADTTVSAKNLTTVPKAVRNFLEVEPGDRLEWHVEDGRITVRKQSEGE
jgi:AbrB family looped-hinge helix DNA binding protein